MNLILRSPDQTKCEGGKPVKTRKVPSRQTPPAATSDKKPGAKRCGVSGLETPPGDQLRGRSTPALPRRTALAPSGSACGSGTRSVD